MVIAPSFFGRSAYPNGILLFEGKCSQTAEMIVILVGWGLISFAVVMVTLSRTRCPACNTILGANTRSITGGKHTVDNCPYCGANLTGPGADRLGPRKALAARVVLHSARAAYRPTRCRGAPIPMIPTCLTYVRFRIAQ